MTRLEQRGAVAFTGPRSIPLIGETKGGDFMPRFFFQVSDGSTFKDEDGEDFPGIESARAHAAQIARELAEAGDYRGFAVKVTDEPGNEVAYVPIGKTN